MVARVARRAAPRSFFNCGTGRIVEPAGHAIDTAGMEEIREFRHGSKICFNFFPASKRRPAGRSLHEFHGSKAAGGQNLESTLLLLAPDRVPRIDCVTEL